MEPWQLFLILAFSCLILVEIRVEQVPQGRGFPYLYSAAMTFYFILAVLASTFDWKF